MKDIMLNKQFICQISEKYAIWEEKKNEYLKISIFINFAKK